MTSIEEILDDFLRAIIKLKELEGGSPKLLLSEGTFMLLNTEGYLGEKYKPKPWYFLHGFIGRELMPPQSRTALAKARGES